MGDDRLNLIGYPQGAFGIAEDVRSLKKVFDSIGFKAKYLLPTFREIKEDIEIKKNYITKMKNGDLNIFSISPMDMMSLALSKDSSFIDNAGYAIGAWPWELPFWPKDFKQVTNFVDEIWAQSTYVESAFNYLGSVRVRKMPMLVQVGEPNAGVRNFFSIPESDFVFYSVLDGNSWVSRKNPLASVRAFQKAFGSLSKGVSLVIKAMNVDLAGDLWSEFLCLISKDPRIILINQKLSKQDLVNLISSCDCFVSLHRSEGFGRNIAEAMLLGIPVIVSNFSGNVDFCNYKTSFLVDGEKIPLKLGDYLFHKGQYWFDADIDEAANQMLLVWEKQERREEIAKNGKLFIEEHYSLDAIRPTYKKTIEEVMLYL